MNSTFLSTVSRDKAGFEAEVQRALNAGFEIVNSGVELDGSTVVYWAYLLKPGT